MRSECTKVQNLRVASRLKVFQPVELHTDKGCVRAHLLNVSATGALVHTPSPPDPGSVVKLTINGGLRAARVVWTDGARLGISFARALLETQVQQLIET